MTIPIPTRMIDLFRLLTWLSPAYPVGGFSYSHGLEMAVEEGAVTNRAALQSYIETVLLAGAGRIDAALLVAAHRAANVRVVAGPGRDMTQCGSTAGLISATRLAAASPGMAGLEPAIASPRGRDTPEMAGSSPAMTRNRPDHAAEAILDRPGSNELDEVVEIALAWRGTAETALEATQQGGSFASITATAWPERRFAAFVARHQGRLTHAVAFGAAAAFHGMALRPALIGWLSGFAANLVSAGVRLVPLGQTDGQRVTAALFPIIEAAADAAEAADIDTLGTAAPMLDQFSLRHETQYTRLFRS